MMVRLSHWLVCLAATVDHLEAESSVRLKDARLTEALDVFEGLSADRSRSAERFDEADEQVSLDELFDEFDKLFRPGITTVHHPRWSLPRTGDPDVFGVGLARAFVAYALLVVDGRGPSLRRLRPALSPTAKTRLRDALWSGLIEPSLAKARAMRARIRAAALIAQADVAFRPAFGKRVPAATVAVLN